GLEELQIVFEDVLNPEKDVAKPRLAHKRRKRIAMIRYRRRHCLHGVVDIVETRVDDRLAQRFEALHVQDNVVIHDKDRSCAAIVRVSNISDYAIERVSEEVPPAHLDDRTETAIEGTPS